jgi:hypothetical protein
MKQTFTDLLRERRDARGSFGLALWMFVDTAAGIVRENITFIAMQNLTRRLGVWAIVVAAVLMIPLWADWPWTGSDFVFGAVVLFGSAAVYELIARRSGNSAYRFAVGIAVVAALLLIWINAAVGIIGEPGGPNVMYLGVLAVGFIGALIARFRSHGMARALFAMAIVQMLVPVVALAVAKPQITMEPPGVVGVFALNAFFAMLFVGSALLFRRASAKGATPSQ